MAGDLQQLDPAIRALLPGYLANRRKDIKNLMRLLAEKQMNEIRLLGHNINGSGGSYGMQDFSKVGHNIEQAALTNDVDALTRHFKDLERCITHLATQLES